MRSDVAIVLNERESTKAHLAGALEARLKALNITVSRPAITQNISAVLRTQAPRVVVLDYLLGDVTTGLDIIEDLRQNNQKNRSAVIFLTDEPSAAVAVAAFRAGAQHFIEIEAPGALETVVSEIETALATSGTERTAPTPTTTELSLDDLVSNSEISQKLMAKLRLIGTVKPPLVVVYGEPGTGVTTTLRALGAEYLGHPFAQEVNLQIGHRNLTSYIFDHVECDDGALFEHISKLGSPHPTVFVGTNDLATARAWGKQQKSVVVQLPSLLERQDDSPELIRRFARELEGELGRKACTFEAAEIAFLTKRTWPGNIRELRAVVQAVVAQRTVTKEMLADLVTVEATAFESHYCPSLVENSPTALEAATMVASCGGRFYLAALRLGCTESKLFSILADGLGGIAKYPFVRRA